MTRKWITLTRCRTALLSRASLLCVVAGALLLVAACGGDSPTPTAPTPTPAPTPAPIPVPPPPSPPPTPVTSVIGEGNSSLPSSTLLYVPFNTTATGTIGVTVDWTFSTNDVDIFLVRGTNPCTIEQFNSNQCPFLAFSASVSAKPERLSVPNLAAGPYTVYIANFGATQESVSFQFTLTSVPGASVASAPSARFGVVKGFLNGTTRAD